MENLHALVYSVLNQAFEDALKCLALALNRFEAVRQCCEGWRGCYAGAKSAHEPREVAVAPVGD